MSPARLVTVLVVDQTLTIVSPSHGWVQPWSRAPVTDHLHHGEAGDLLSLIDAADLGHALVLGQIVGRNFLLTDERPDFQPAVQ